MASGESDPLFVLFERGMFLFRLAVLFELDRVEDVISAYHLAFSSSWGKWVVLSYLNRRDDKIFHQGIGWCVVCVCVCV